MNLSTETNIRFFQRIANEAASEMYVRYERALLTKVRRSYSGEIPTDGLAIEINHLPLRQRQNLYNAYNDLYELTALETPFTGREFRNLSLDELWDAIEQIEDVISYRIKKARENIRQTK